MLGWVAAVIAMVSPSHPRPAVFQRISISGIARGCRERSSWLSADSCMETPPNRILHRYETLRNWMSFYLISRPVSRDPCRHVGRRKLTIKLRAGLEQKQLKLTSG